jgi:hypothetical protein
LPIRLQRLPPDFSEGVLEIIRELAAFNGEWLVEDAEKFIDSMVRGSASLEMMRKNLPDGVWTK